jgi:hypothetical protein
MLGNRKKKSDANQQTATVVTHPTDLDIKYNIVNITKPIDVIIHILCANETILFYFVDDVFDVWVKICLFFSFVIVHAHTHTHTVVVDVKFIE